MKQLPGLATAVLFAATGILASCAQGGGDEPLDGAIAAQAAVCSPELTVDGKRYEAGTAFVVDAADGAGAGGVGAGGARPLLVTAHHLFGELGGLDEEIAWQDMPRRATMVRCRQLKGSSQWTTGAALAIAGAHPISATSLAQYRDIAAFPIAADAGTVPRLTLAEHEPATGSKVWLIARIVGGDPAVLLHRATVVGHEQGAMVYAFDDTRIELQATSGAPVINAAGKLVGINLGGTTAEGSNDVQGVADSLDVVRTALSTAGPDERRSVRPLAAACQHRLVRRAEERGSLSARSHANGCAAAPRHPWR